MALRVAVKSGSWVQVYAELPQHLAWGICALTVVMVPVSEVQACVDLLWNWSLGLWFLLQGLKPGVGEEVGGLGSIMGPGMTGCNSSFGLGSGGRSSMH